MAKQPGSMDEGDVVDLLIRQHEEIRTLFAEVTVSKGDKRRETFDRLRRLLAVHETAEEEIVHPNARRIIQDGDRVVNERLAEENLSKRMLSELERIGTDSPEFARKLEQLRQAVESHAESEEREEFPALRRNSSPERLRVMKTAVKVAEALAPTHPHPGVESTGANLLAGPFLAVMDRTRDVMRKAVKRT
ncbi:hemerythrin domain-containing protein [Actinomadura alba]|uniref:Hemerythrin domain-containing protein n=1 Tax=Actinomadura alba TaxID=406431 RepID=A0ABR7M2C6_9ACTN|nr:hemerythrin domain-containing protein [Actinomadura alba]MBC6471263.1 hemerythrin domain-containing protein [Actinomadura alba]